MCLAGCQSHIQVLMSLMSTDHRSGGESSCFNQLNDFNWKIIIASIFVMDVTDEILSFTANRKLKESDT